MFYCFSEEHLLELEWEFNESGCFHSFKNYFSYITKKEAKSLILTQNGELFYKGQLEVGNNFKGLYHQLVMKKHFRDLSELLYQAPVTGKS